MSQAIPSIPDFRIQDIATPLSEELSVWHGRCVTWIRSLYNDRPSNSDELDKIVSGLGQLIRTIESSQSSASLAAVYSPILPAVKETRELFLQLLQPYLLQESAFPDDEPPPAMAASSSAAGAAAQSLEGSALATIAEGEEPSEKAAPSFTEAPSAAAAAPAGSVAPSQSYLSYFWGLVERLRSAKEPELTYQDINEIPYEFLTEIKTLRGFLSLSTFKPEILEECIVKLQKDFHFFRQKFAANETVQSTLLPTLEQARKDLALLQKDSCGYREILRSLTQLFAEITETRQGFESHSVDLTQVLTRLLHYRLEYFSLYGSRHFPYSGIVSAQPPTASKEDIQSLLAAGNALKMLEKGCENQLRLQASWSQWVFRTPLLDAKLKELLIKDLKTRGSD